MSVSKQEAESELYLKRGAGLGVHPVIGPVRVAEPEEPDVDGKSKAAGSDAGAVGAAVHATVDAGIDDVVEIEEIEKLGRKLKSTHVRAADTETAEHAQIVADYL